MKPDLYGFITTMIKVTYVIWQLQGLPKTSSNPPTFSESPILKIGSGRKRLISEHKGFLPSSNRKSGGRGHVGPYLCRRPSTSVRLSDCHPCSIGSGRGSRGGGYFLRPSRGLIGSAGPFSTFGGGGGRGRRRSLLPHRLSARQETFDYHITAYHHGIVMVFCFGF